MKDKKHEEIPVIKKSRFEEMKERIRQKAAIKKAEKDQKRKENIEYNKKISQLKETTKINLNELVSDLRFFKMGFWNKTIASMQGTKYCMCIIHYPQSTDVVRYFPMVKPFVLDINKTLYLFSPKAFRYLNGTPKLEFYANIPFAIIHNVTDKYTPPSLDAEAFSSVQNSKFIQDATKTDNGENMNVWLIAIIVLVIICIIASVFNVTYVMKIAKAMAIK